MTDDFAPRWVRTVHVDYHRLDGDFINASDEDPAPVGSRVFAYDPEAKGGRMGSVVSARRADSGRYLLGIALDVAAANPTPEGTTT